MAVATTIRSPQFNTGFYGFANLRFMSGVGVSAGMPLTIAGDTTVLTVFELPNTTWRCDIVATNRGNARLIFKPGDTITG